MMGRTGKLTLRILLVIGVYVPLSNLLHRVVFPQAPPEPSTFPREGDRFGSQVEGFQQPIAGVDNGWVTSRLEATPGASGPPVHVQETFKEVLTVESGTLHLEGPEGVVQLEPGEVYEIEPGTPHRPFNPTEDVVVLAGTEPVMPLTFAACLVQIYHILDAAEGRMSPALMLRIEAMDPICGSTLPEIPSDARVATRWLAIPTARLFGYRNYYPELSLHLPQGT
jgi:hypothetical protein